MVIVLAIGKTILILLIVIACILAAVLFLPVRYEVDADIDEKCADVRVNWLFRLVRFRFHAGDGVRAALSVLFFKIDFTDPKAKKKRAAKKAKKEARKIARAGQKNEKNRRGGVGDGAAGFGKNAKRILGLVKKYEVLETVLPELVRFLNRIRPRKLTGCVAFGLEDPATTGKLVGALAAVPLFYETELRVIPDFETDETYVKGQLDTKGHILLIWIVVLAVGLIKEKKIRRFVDDLRNGREA